MNNAPVHTVARTRNFLTEKAIQSLGHPPYSPYLAPANVFLFPTVKAALAGNFIEGTSVKTAWERVVGGLPKEAFFKAYQKWHDRRLKCVRLEGEYVEKMSKKSFLLKRQIKSYKYSLVLV